MEFVMDGITLVTGRDNYIPNVNGTILINPENNLCSSSQISFAERIIKSIKETNNVILIVTNSIYFIRAIEVYCDLFCIMDKLNVYLWNNNKFENVSYSEYGITEVYEIFNEPLYLLEKKLEDKYNKGE